MDLAPAYHRSWRSEPHWRPARPVSSSSAMPRNDPTDTGGLFIGRRPGTGPLRYRSAPERGGDRRRRADAAPGRRVLALETLVCLTLWGPQPVAWLWVGSQVDYHTARSRSGSRPRSPG